MLAESVATAVGIVAGVAIGLATVIGSQHLAWLIVFVIIAVVAAALVMALKIPDISALLNGRSRGRMSRTTTPQAATLPLAPVITEAWKYTSDGNEANAAMHAGELLIPGSGCRMQPDHRPPWIRFVVLISCSQIGGNVEPAQLWAIFEEFLKETPVSSLVGTLTRPSLSAKWTRWATNRAATIDAVFTPAGELEALASARLELPDGTSRSGRDPRCALLILHFEPLAQDKMRLTPRAPISWTYDMTQALELPNALNKLLTEQLGLTTSAEPPVVLGFRLDTPHDLTELIDITGLTTLPGGQRKREAIGYFIADGDGAPASDVVHRMINDVLLYALQAER